VKGSKCPRTKVDPLLAKGAHRVLGAGGAVPAAAPILPRRRRLRP
jgi:hypothetical protein